MLPVAWPPCGFFLVLSNADLDAVAEACRARGRFVRVHRRICAPSSIWVGPAS